jgi:general secretion pathway protein G
VVQPARTRRGAPAGAACPRAAPVRPVRAGAGFTLLELLVAVGIVATLAGMAFPAYLEFSYKARVGRAIAELETLQTEIEGFYLGTHTYPASLADIGRDTYLDPWGRPYRYLNIATSGAGLGALRKDRSLVPVNSDYDLYSVGRDGQTTPAFTAANSQDDVVRANNGGYLGLVRNY